MSVVANQFIIRDILPNHTDFLYSDNLWEVAKRNGLWDEKKDKYLDFTKVISYFFFLFYFWLDVVIHGVDIRSC